MNLTYLLDVQVPFFLDSAFLWTRQEHHDLDPISMNERLSDDVSIADKTQSGSWKAFLYFWSSCVEITKIFF